MSTTVIASPRGWTLVLAPWMGGTVDDGALAEVLARYDLELLPGATTGNEFIAAQGLSHAKAARLAEDLRKIDLTVRVVNKTAITQSQRVGQAMAALGLVAFLFPLMAVALQGEVPQGLNWALLPVALFALANFLTLQLRGAGRLPVAGTEPETHANEEVALLVEEIRGLRDELPDHLVMPLLARAERLDAAGGESENELSALASEVRGDRDQRAAAEIRDLREELRQARRAAAELRR